MNHTQNFGLTTETVEVPENMTNRQSVKKYRKTEKGQAVQNKYRHNTSTWHSETSYLSRPFIAWDGEGVTLTDGSHLYTLLASLHGTSIKNRLGLGTAEIFDSLIASKIAHPDGINVIYGGSYDFNMFMRDLSHDHLNKLYETGVVYWRDYRIEWRRGKSFRVTDRVESVTITIYDVVSFFQCPFVKACDDYLGERFIERDMIVANKAARGTFTAEDDATVEMYNDAELQNLLLLMDELRLRLVKVHLRPRRWDGPGAIATALLQRESIKQSMAESPQDVAKAARFAYAGGRFEVIKCGDVKETAYEYDINSAYPAALRKVPNLAAGRWVKVSNALALDSDNFGIWQVEWEGEPDNLYLPQPFFARGKDGTVSYPRRCAGWYWTPEVIAAQEYIKRYGGKLTITKGHVFLPHESHDKPFAFIDGMYLKRQALKKAGDGAHVGLKLGLNSLYGKTCQRVGYTPAQDGNPAKTPPFHQIEWAGYVTSWCRANILTAALDNLEAVIAFETDALFTTEPVAVKCGTALGEWEFTKFDSLCYAQSGMYFGEVDGKPFAKTRGVDRDTLTYEHAKKRLSRPYAYDRYVDATLTRFIGVGLARALNDWNRWTRWETSPKRVMLDPKGKRVHEECVECSHGEGLANGVWHDTYPPFGRIQYSHEYPIPWINPNPDMIDLDDWNIMRREEMAADYE